MRISDWSSDVCSSDLCRIAPIRPLSTRAHVSKTLHLAYLPQRCISDFLPPACRRSSRGKKDRPPRPSLPLRADAASSDRKSVVEGKRVSVRVDPGGRRIIKKKKTKQIQQKYWK